MITETNDYFTKGCGRCARFATPNCSTRLWSLGLAALRGLCLDAGLSEHVKWGHPCYMHAGRNIAIIGAFRADFRLSFFDAALLSDPSGLLHLQGPNSAQPNMLRFVSNDVTPQADVIRGFLVEAMAHAAAGRRAPKVTRSLEMPDELAEALDMDAELSEAFHALTPGRQNSHVIQIAGAKKAETRVARIAKLRPRILAGKGALER